VAVGLLKTAWDADWLGIKTTLVNFWNNSILPAFNSLKQWLDTNIPVATQFLSDVWNNTLLPALTGVWEFLSGTLWPLFETVSGFMRDVFAANVRVLAGVWTEVLYPALEDVWGLLAESLQPTFETIERLLSGAFMTAVERVSSFFKNDLTAAFAGVVEWVGRLIDILEELRKKYQEVKPPAALTPGSPTPFEMGIRGIVDAVDELARVSLPKLQAEFAATGQQSGRAYGADAHAARLALASAGAGSSSIERNYNLTLQTRMDAQTVEQGFDHFRLMGG
jgi:hypothetical protein